MSSGSSSSSSRRPRNKNFPPLLFLLWWKEIHFKPLHRGKLRRGVARRHLWIDHNRSTQDRRRGGRRGHGWRMSGDAGRGRSRPGQRHRRRRSGWRGSRRFGRVLSKFVRNLGDCRAHLSWDRLELPRQGWRSSDGSTAGRTFAGHDVTQLRFDLPSPEPLCVVLVCSVSTAPVLRVVDPFQALRACHFQAVLLAEQAVFHFLVVGARRRLETPSRTEVDIVARKVVQTETLLELIGQFCRSFDGRRKYDVCGERESSWAERYERRVTLVSGLRYICIDFGFALEQLWVDHFAVEDASASGGRQHQPQDKADLQLIIERKPDENIISESFGKTEQRKYNPVHHPFHVFFDVFASDGFEWRVRGIEDAHAQSKTLICNWTHLCWRSWRQSSKVMESGFKVQRSSSFLDSTYLFRRSACMKIKYLK